jgi:cytochrome oxidase Cu insertion factor (SCO1/SenC/PrrC family)
MIDGFKVAVAKKPAAKPGDEFDHSTRLVLVDKTGDIRGYYDGMSTDRDLGGSQFEEGLAKLKAKVKELERE